MKKKIIDFNRVFSGDVVPRINWKLFIITLVLGYGIHSFRITQMINAADDVSVLFRGYGAGTTFGRWGLDFLGFRVNYKWVIGSFNLPAFNGVVTLILLTLSACLILELFDLQKSKFGILFSAVFVSYPVCSSTFLYMFTAAYYGLSCFLAVLAAWCLKERKILHGILALICIAFSLGLYQAYFPVTVTLCLFLVLDYFLKSDADFKTGLRDGVYYVCMLVLGLVLYLIILNNRLDNLGAELSDYQGINSTGQIGIKSVPGLIMKCYKVFLRLPTEIYHSINTLSVVRKGILVLFVLCIFLYICHMWKRKKWFDCIMITALLMLAPIAINLIEIMCAKSDIYELMVYSTVFIYLLPIIFFNRLKIKNRIEQIVISFSGICIAIILSISALGYSWHANWNYVAVDYMNRETESYMTTLVTRIKLTENYKDEYPVLFIGERKFSDKQFINPYSDYQEYYFVKHQQVSLINAFSWKNAMTAYTGFTCTEPTKQQYDEIIASKQLQNMPCYPDAGSIAVINDVIVVKITDEQVN